MSVQMHDTLWVLGFVFAFTGLGTALGWNLRGLFEAGRKR